MLRFLLWTFYGEVHSDKNVVPTGSSYEAVGSPSSGLELLPLDSSPHHYIKIWLLHRRPFRTTVGT